jgi:protein gp37
VPEKLLEPLRWKQSRTIFVNSMSDLFHEGVPDSFIVAVAKTMELANWHTYQVLTKRADRMVHLLETKLDFVANLDHIWWGVSVEDKAYGLPRCEALRHSGASIKFLSIEPLLEDLGKIKLDGINWVIVGGESGAGARPMEEKWVLSIQKQCKQSKIPFFFKQWGGIRKKENGRTLNGRTHDELPQRRQIARELKKEDQLRLTTELSSLAGISLEAIGAR